jgi:hypothetical protein
MRSYSQYSIDIMVRFWAKKQNAVVMYNCLQEKIDNYASVCNVLIGLQQDV